MRFFIKCTFMCGLIMVSINSASLSNSEATRATNSAATSINKTQNKHREAPKDLSASLKVQWQCSLDALRICIQRHFGFKIQFAQRQPPGRAVAIAYSRVTHSFSVGVQKIDKAISSAAASGTSTISQLSSYLKAVTSKDSIQSTTNNKQECCLEKRWTDGNNSATEKCARVNTVQTALDISEGQLKLLLKDSAKNREAIIEETKNKQKLEREVQRGTTWATSNNYRDLYCGEIKKLNHANQKNPWRALKNMMQGRFDSAAVEKYLSLETFKEIVDEKYVALTKNMRIHSVVSDQLAEEPNVCNYVMRCGVVSDMSNGYTNLEQINKIRTYAE